MNVFKKKFKLLLQNKRFPFDTNGPIGYLIACIIEYISIGFTYYIIACTTAFGIGIIFTAISMTKELQRILQLINGKVHSNENQSSELSNLFSEFIDIHGIVKQFSIKEHDFFSLQYLFIANYHF